MKVNGSYYIYSEESEEREREEGKIRHEKAIMIALYKGGDKKECKSNKGITAQEYENIHNIRWSPKNNSQTTAAKNSGFRKT